MSDDEERGEDKKKRGRKRRATTSSKSANRGPRYPEGIPVDEHGAPLQDVEVPASQMRKLGVYDKESARILQMTKNFRNRRESGEKNIRFDGPDFVKFEEMVQEYPAASIRFRMIEPVVDDNVQGTTIAACGSWQKMIDHLRTRHWRGQQAVYQWAIFDATNYQHATGKVHFAAAQEADEPIQPGPQMQNPYNPYGQMMPNPMMPGMPPGMAPGMPPMSYPGYGMQPPMPGMMGAPQPQAPQLVPFPWPMPMPQQQQPAQQAQAPQPQQAPAPIPTPPFQPMPGMATDPNMVAMMMQVIRENQQLLDQVRQQAQQAQQPQQPMIPPQMMMQYMMAYPWMFGMGAPPQQQQQAPKPEPKPEPPPSPLQIATSAFDEMMKVHRLTKKFVNEISPEREDETPKPPEPPPDDNLPHTIRELPHMRAVFDKASGQPVDGVTMLMYNGDKVMDAGKGFFKEMRSMIDEFRKQKTETVQSSIDMQKQQLDLKQKELQQQEEALQQGERLAAIMERTKKAAEPSTMTMSAAFVAPPAPFNQPTQVYVPSNGEGSFTPPPTPPEQNEEAQ